MDTDHIQLGEADSERNEVEEIVFPAQQQQVEDHEDDIEKVGRANVFTEKMIRKLDQVGREFRKSYIFKVDDATRNGHQNPYEPILFGIGPYHRGKSNLQAMEEHKWKCLNRMIERVTKHNNQSRSDLIVRCYEVVEELEDVARGYYAEDTTGINSDDFLEMLLLDGCFLIDIIREEISDGEDPLLNRRQIEGILNHDVLLLENQLPLFVLGKLHSVMVNITTDGSKTSLLQLATQSNILLSVFQAIRPLESVVEDFFGIGMGVSKLYGNSPEFSAVVEPDDEEKMLAGIEVREMGRTVNRKKLMNTKHLLEFIYNVLLKEDILYMPTSSTIQMVPPQGQVEESSIITLMKELVRNTYTATELSNAGVKFKPVHKTKFYDIQFKNRTLEIPRITINKNTTEGILRNLMAYEAGDESEFIINDYVTFMDSIISSEKDVELLRIHGIIEHFLGKDEAVSTMFNQLGAISVRQIEYHYSDLVKQLKHYCEKRHNVWMAKLRSDYFSSPWAIISVFAAFVLLVLTVISTVYTPLSYYNPG